MTTPAYIANPTDHPAWRGNTYATGYGRPWMAPTNDQERLGHLQALYGALCVVKTMAAGLGTATDDYETSIQGLLERVSGEKRAILEGCK